MINSGEPDSTISDNFIDYGPSLSEITEQHDIIWNVWNDINEQIDQFGVPILDRCKYPDFLEFVMGGNVYSE